MAEVTRCGSCGSGGLTQFFDMGLQPLAEGGGKGSYPLKLLRCPRCTLVQLSYIVDQKDVFRPDHPYTTGNSAVLRRHYAQLAREIIPGLRPNKSDVVVDIGANDGTLLNYLHARARCIAVEPTSQVQKTYEDVIRYQDFFSRPLAHEIHAKYGQAAVITACNVFAHVPDPHDFLDGVTELLAPDGVFITENHDLASITEGLQIDTIYHEHLRYYTVASLTSLLERHGLHVTSSLETPMHGGSFRVTARKQRDDFPARARIAVTALRGMLWQLAEQEHQAVYGIGATTRATPLIHYAGIKDFITCVCEVSSSEKIGTVIPGTQIPVVDEAKLIADQPPYALLLSWHIADDIIPKLRAAGYQGKFIVPLPSPRTVVDG